MDTNTNLNHGDSGQPPGAPQQSWQVTVDSPQRYSTPSAIETSEPTQTYTTSTAQNLTATLSSLGGVQLTDGQNFNPSVSSAPFQPVFALSSANYDTQFKIEDYNTLVSNSIQGMSLPTVSSMSTLQHLQQILQQAGDRKVLPPHLQVVPLFDPASGFGALQRNIAVTQVTMSTGLSSIGLGINSLSGINMLSGTTTVTSLHSMTPPISSFSNSALDTKEQLVSQVHMTHNNLLTEQSQNNQAPGMQNSSQLFPMVQLNSGFRTTEPGQDTSLIMPDADTEHTMHLALTEAARKQITDSFSAAAGDEASGTHSPAFTHLHQPRHYTDSAETYQTQATNEQLSMTPSLSDRISGTLHSSITPNEVNTIPTGLHVNESMANERLMAGSHDTNADLSGGGMIQANSSSLHMMESVPQGMLGLNSRTLHDPMVTQHESSDEDELVNATNNQQTAPGIYESADNDLFATRKSQRIAEREHTPSPEQRPFYLPKEYYSISEIWCEDCQTSYIEECMKHKSQSLYDKVVLSRAWATLPSLLQIFRLGETTELGVFSKKPISKRTKFGPFYAPLVETPEQVTNKRFMLKLENEDGSQYFLEPSDENNCNWMMFVRPAENYAEQNVVAFQYKMDIFYVTTKHIEPKQELKVWYAAPYADRMGVQPHRPSEEELQALDANNRWPCYECNKSFRSSALLQKHLTIHDENTLADTFNDDDILDEEEPISTKGRRKGKAGKGKAKKIKELVGEENTVFQSWKKRKTNMYLNKIKKYREPIKRSLMTLYKKQGKDSGGNEWVCTHCDLTFDNPSLLNLHTLTHAAEDLAAVDLNSALVTGVESDQKIDVMFCGDMTGAATESIQSVIQWDESNLQCPVCDKVFGTKQELILHASEHARRGRRALRIHPRKPFKCMTCWKSFTTDERLQKHMLCHSEKAEKPFKCDTCNKRFMNNSALACHLKTHSDKKYYECPICVLGFDQIHAMKEHIQGHAVNGLFDCPECHKSFPDYKMVRRHIKAFHSSKRYPCVECGKDFARPDKLKLHMLKHSSHREFMCETCGRQFKRKDKLSEHVKRMHNPQRSKNDKSVTVSPLKKFAPKVEPNDYNRFIYKCHMCMLGFKRRGMLVNHIAKRHPEMKSQDIPELNLPILRTNRDYFCQYCDKVYKSSSKRKMHIIKYHPGGDLPPSIRTKALLEKYGVPNASFSQPAGSVTTMPHPCELCHKQYASKAKLLQHQRKKHPEVDASLNERRRLQIQVQAGNNGELTINQALLEKSRLLAAFIQKPMDNTGPEVITITPQAMQNLEALQGTDLLTQAMSELSELRTQTHQLPGTTIEYQLAGVVPPGGTATLLQQAAVPQHHTIELSQLGQLGQTQIQRSLDTQVMHSIPSTNGQIISPITVVSSGQAAQMLANAIPITLGSPYLQKGTTINWSTAPSLPHSYR